MALRLAIGNRAVLVKASGVLSSNLILCFLLFIFFGLLFWRVLILILKCIGRPKVLDLLLLVHILCLPKRLLLHTNRLAKPCLSHLLVWVMTHILEIVLADFHKEPKTATLLELLANCRLVKAFILVHLLVELVDDLVLWLASFHVAKGRCLTRFLVHKWALIAV